MAHAAGDLLPRGPLVSRLIDVVIRRDVHDGGIEGMQRDDDDRITARAATDQTVQNDRSNGAENESSHSGSGF